MQHNMKRIFFFILLISGAFGYGQSTINSFTYSTRFLNSDLLQMYEGARIAAPTMTLPSSISTFTYSQPFINTDNLQLYNAIRGIGDAVSTGSSNAWNITGNAPATNTNFIGTTNNTSLLFRTNNTQRLKIDSLGYAKVTNTVIEKGTFEVISAGNTSVSIGGVYGGGVGAIWCAQQPTLTDNNFQIAGTGNSTFLLNAPNDSGNVTIAAGNSLAMLKFRANKNYDSNTAIEIGDNGWIRKRQGATFNIPNIWVKRFNNEWLAGTVPIQWNFYIEGSRVMATSTSSITNYYTQWNAAGTASTNMSIGNNWGFGTAGMAHITSSVLIGTSARTPSATLDVTGTMSVSSTATLTGLRNNGTFTTTGAAQIASLTVSSGSIIGNGSNFYCYNAANFRIQTGSGAGVYLDAGGTNGVLSAFSNSVVISQQLSVGTVTSSGGINSTSKTAGIGYGVGSGSTTTQGTSRTTGVTINAVTGSITLFSAAGSTSWQSFTMTNSAIGVNDVVKVVQRSGTDLYQIFVTNVAAGSCRITFATTGGTTTEQPVFNFAVIKGQTN